MNKIKVFHCINCLRNLHHYGEGLIDIYERLCDSYVNVDCEPIVFDFGHKPTFKVLNKPIQLLEAEGYVVSTEHCRVNKTYIQVRCEGLYQIADDLYEFCPLDCNQKQRYGDYELD